MKIVLAVELKRLFNFEGKEIQNISSRYKEHHFDIVDWPSESNILIGRGGFYKWKAIIINLKGKDIFKHKLRNFYVCHGPQGTSIKFAGDKKPYLAILGHSKSTSYLTQLSIFSPSKELIYQEILESTRGLCAIPCQKDQVEVLLVGDSNTKVWEYSFNHT